MNFPMIKWAKDLYPICRSITGKGTEETLKYFKKLNPEFKIINFKSGSRVFDWKIPKRMEHKKLIYSTRKWENMQSLKNQICM